MYQRANDGRIVLVGRFSTGGRGSGGTNDPLQSQNALVLTEGHRFLLTVNAATSDISVFRVGNAGLTLMSVTPSGGSGPISIAVHGDLVYVVNYVGNYHTAGFRLSPDGQLHAVDNSRQPLSTLDMGVCTISFSPDGTKLVITERISNKVDVFTVNSDGSIGNPVYNPSAGAGPFGVAFTGTGVLLVTETNGGPPKCRYDLFLHGQRR
jgi:6-phosphogluconolactonase (cycloisomerase 2 family)